MCLQCIVDTNDNIFVYNQCVNTVLDRNKLELFVEHNFLFKYKKHRFILLFCKKI